MLDLFFSKTFRGYAVIAIITCLVDVLTKRTLSNPITISIVNTSVMAIIAIALVFLLLKTINSLQEVYYKIAVLGLTDALKETHRKIINKIVFRFHFVVNAVVVTVLSIFRGIGVVKDDLFFLIVFSCALIFRFLFLVKTIEIIKENCAKSASEKRNSLNKGYIFEQN